MRCFICSFFEFHNPQKKERKKERKKAKIKNKTKTKTCYDGWCMAVGGAAYHLSKLVATDIITWQIIKFGISIFIKMGAHLIVWVGASIKCFHRFSVTESQCD